MFIFEMYKVPKVSSLKYYKKSKEMIKHRNHLFAIGRSKNMKTILINRHTLNYYTYIITRNKIFCNRYLQILIVNLYNL